MLTGPRTKVQPMVLALIMTSLLAPSVSSQEGSQTEASQLEAPQTTPASIQGDLSIERLFAAPDLSGSSLRRPRFSPDGRWVTFLQGKDTDKDRLDIWAYDLQRGQRFLLVDSSEIVADEGNLSPEDFGG